MISGLAFQRNSWNNLSHFQPLSQSLSTSKLFHNSITLIRWVIRGILVASPFVSAAELLHFQFAVPGSFFSRSLFFFGCVLGNRYGTAFYLILCLDWTRTRSKVKKSEAMWKGNRPIRCSKKKYNRPDTYRSQLGDRWRQ